MVPKKKENMKFACLNQYTFAKMLTTALHVADDNIGQYHNTCLASAKSCVSLLLPQNLHKKTALHVTEKEKHSINLLKSSKVVFTQLSKVCTSLDSSANN